MEILTILWMVAGFLCGGIFLNILLTGCNQSSPTLFLLSSSLVGSLTAYTIINGVCIS
jgi:hypothetical protein